MATRDLVIGTAGHIDHGKTALVRALTGVDTDRLPAEKQRGITIDLGFAPLDLDGVHAAFVDVPGHERFIRNMLAGATGLDLALLVVAADDSVMPQTREHLEILQLLGLTGGVIAITKADLVDDAWLALVSEDVRALVAGTFLENAAIVPTSSRTGAGIPQIRQTLKTLFDSSPNRPDPGLFRLAIDRAFTVAGHGTVVTGTVASGQVAVGDELIWHPEGRPVRVRGLQRHDKPAVRIGRGGRAAINLVGVHHSEIARGQELSARGYLSASRVMAVEIRACKDAPRPLRHRGRYRLHMGTAGYTVVLSLLDSLEIRPGETATGQLFLKEPGVSVSGQPFVLREESPAATLGGGRVLAPTSRRVRRRDKGELARYRKLGSTDPVGRAEAALAGFGLKVWNEAALCREAGLRADEVEAVLARLTRSEAVIDLPVGPRRTVRLPSEFVSALEDRVLRALARLHADRPRQSTVPRSHLVSELADLESDSLVGGLIDRLSSRKKVVVEGRAVALAGHEPKLSQGERKLKNEIAAAFRSGGFSPPDLADLTAAAGARSGVVPELLTLLCEEEKIVALGPQLYLDFDAEADLRQKVVDRLCDGAKLTMAELRDLLGTTRKYAVPIGEYLDRSGITTREGDLRRLGPDGHAHASRSETIFP